MVSTKNGRSLVPSTLSASVPSGFKGGVQYALNFNSVGELALFGAVVTPYIARWEL